MLLPGFAGAPDVVVVGATVVVVVVVVVLVVVEGVAGATVAFPGGGLMQVLRIDSRADSSDSVTVRLHRT